MGRRKKDKSKSAQNNVDDFTVDKDEQLKAFDGREINPKLTQEVINKFDIKPVRKTSDLTGERLDTFNGKNYEDSLKLLYEWRDRYNNQSEKDMIILVNYYPQEFKSKSIIVSYNLKMK